MDAICELRTEELNAVFCNNAKEQRVVSKHYHSLKCRKLRLLQQGLSFETHMLFMNMSLSLKKGQFLLVRAVGGTEKGGFTMGGILSLSVDEEDWQISLF